MRFLLSILFCGILFILNSEGSYSIESNPADSLTFECSEPITWRVGSIDSRYEIDESDLVDIMKEVQQLWSEPVSQNLIQYSDSGEVAIHLIFSEDQKFTQNEKLHSEQINRMRKRYYSMRMDYQSEADIFREKLSHYNQIFAQYASIVNSYNERLSRMTTSGIISRDDDEQLKSLKKEMEFLEKKLNPLEEELTTEEEKLNRSSDKLNRHADKVNENIFQYRDRFSETRTFYQGFYTHVGNQKKINIYQFDNTDRLRLVLAHEFGHALGLSHASNPASIMNYNMQFQLEEKLLLTDEDRSAIQSKCNPSQVTLH